jgi:hypothetical protein
VVAIADRCYELRAVQTPPEQQVVRSVNSRRYVDEATTAYSAGALRSAIIALWIAVVADLIERPRTLSDGEVPAAVRLAEKLDRGLTKGAVLDLQSFERDILEAARDQLHLIGAFATGDEDRFAPTPELVRASGLRDRWLARAWRSQWAKGDRTLRARGPRTLVPPRSTGARRVSLRKNLVRVACRGSLKADNDQTRSAADS